jgi:hypothetical protein
VSVGAKATEAIDSADIVRDHGADQLSRSVFMLVACHGRDD